MHSICRSLLTSKGGLLASLLMAALAAMPAMDRSHAQSFSIAATVNDEPISQWDVDQRAKFYQLTSQVKSLDAVRKRALDELIEELLMMQEARRAGVTVDDADVRESIGQRLAPLKRTYAQFKQYLGSQGVDIATLDNRVRAQMIWGQVVAQTYRNQITIDETDIEEVASEIESEDSAGGDETFVLQRILLEVPEGAGDADYLRRMEEAEDIRQAFIDCDRNKTSLKRYAAVTIEDLEDVKADSLREPTQSLVLQASAGEMTPPNVTAGGVEIYAVCDRGADTGRRTVAQRQLFTQELSMLAARHLRDVRQDAVVEYR